MSYQLTLPTMPANADYAATATWLNQTASAVSDAAGDFLDALSDLDAIEFSQVGDLPEFNSVVWLGSASGVLDRPARPDMTIGNVQSLLDALAALQPPAAPGNTFSYLDPGYVSALRSPLHEKLLYDLLNGGYGIDANDEQALFDRERDREDQAAQVNVAEVRRSASATGFGMPQGAMFAAEARARQESLAKASSVNRDIALRRSELFVQHRARVIEQVLKSEDQSIGLYNAVQERQLRSAEINTRIAVLIFDASMKAFTAQIEALKTSIDAQLDSARATIQIYAADVASYSAFVNAVTSAANVDIANSRNVLERDFRAHQSRVDIIKFQLQQLGMTLEKNKEIYKYGSEFFRTAFGSVLNGINGLAVQTAEV